MCCLHYPHAPQCRSPTLKFITRSKKKDKESMCFYEERLWAVQLYIQSGKRFPASRTFRRHVLHTYSQVTFMPFLTLALMSLCHAREALSSIAAVPRCACCSSRHRTFCGLRGFYSRRQRRWRPDQSLSDVNLSTREIIPASQAQFLT